jgi:xanthosine utilization system XapX-like protein
MKHLKKFNENYKPINEEVVGLALMAGLAGVLAAPAVYSWAKNFWSKNVIGSKYDETGKVEKVVTKLPQEIAFTALLSKSQRESGEVVTELKEYVDNLGNKFWGYDHLWSPDDMEDYNEYVASCDLYTALYKAEDLEALKKFLANSERYSGKGVSGKPNPIEMIYRESGRSNEYGNY